MRNAYASVGPAICAAIVAALLAGCASVSAMNPQSAAGTSSIANVSLVPRRSAATFRPSWYRAAPSVLKKGVYVAEYYTNAILGYDWATRKNGPPICSLVGSYVVNVATDPAGNLIDPDGGSRRVIVYRGPAMCGSELGSFADGDGQPSDAATWNAATGTIYVANIQATCESYGNVSVCTLAGGCNALLSNAAIGGQLFAVAEDARGNVYASGYAKASGSGASLVYWKNGKGKGAVIKAYRNAWPGGLDVDGNGNILAFDTFAQQTGALWIYAGCPDHCAAYGPFPLRGESVFGRVNAKGSVLEVADFEYGQIDVYRYAGTKGITYLYSYSDGLTPSGDVEGIAIDPAAED